MSALLHELPLKSAWRTPDADALCDKHSELSYADLQAAIDRWAAAFRALGLGRQERVAVYLPKTVDAVAAMFGAARAGGVFVPVNPLLRPKQVAYILNDCNVRILVTSAARDRELADDIDECHDLHVVVLTDGDASADADPAVRRVSWQEAAESTPPDQHHRVIDTDMAAILYTSGSTGNPKGVVLTHRNVVAGADSVSRYLENTADDRLLGVLPLSFDYGFSQLSTAFHVGASVALMEYLLARDVIRAAERFDVTGLAGVPPLWTQLATLPWPEAVSKRLRYITNSGGAMPTATLGQLRDALPATQVFLMYGLTEAFRSTYLPPTELDNRPESMGKAIPNAEVMVLREDGSPCAPGEPGELVHRGALVSAGYWNDPERTNQRFRPIPGHQAGIVIPELAVWSGDTVRADEDGFLYFIGRRDDMIKTSGYRVSPTEVEEVAYASGLVAEASAIGVAHPTLGQSITLVVTPRDGSDADSETLLAAFRQTVAGYMVPSQILWRDSLPRNPNGKINRKQLAAELAEAAEQAAG